MKKQIHLQVSSSGQIDIHGKQYTPTWTNLATTAAAGATSITLKDAVKGQWQVGQQIVIVTTYYKDTASNQNEVRVITGVTGSTVSFAQPLAFSHYGYGSVDCIECVLMITLQGLHVIVIIMLLSSSLLLLSSLLSSYHISPMHTSPPHPYSSPPHPTPPIHQQGCRVPSRGWPAGSQHTTAGERAQQHRPTHICKWCCGTVFRRASISNGSCGCAWCMCVDTQ